MASARPFLLFEGNCAEAMTFYQSCFGGALSLSRVRDTPMAGQVPADQQDLVINAHLESGDVVITATDWMHATRKPQHGNLVSVVVRSNTLSELEAIFNGLSDGADPDLLDPLVDLPFGKYGHLVDRFGVGWFFVGPQVS